MKVILQNLESIIAAAVLLAVLVLVSLYLIRCKKRGKHLCGGCGGACGGCPNAGACHGTSPAKKK